MYIKPCSGENVLKLLFGTIQFISLTRPRFDVWHDRRSQLKLGRPKVEIGVTHEKFDVCPRPYSTILSFNSES